jgi:hypothetical protein
MMRCLGFRDQRAEILVLSGKIRVLLENLIGEGASFSDELGVGDEIGEAEVGEAGLRGA